MHFKNILPFFKFLINNLFNKKKVYKYILIFTFIFIIINSNPSHFVDIIFKIV